MGSLLFVAGQKRGGMFKPEKYLAEHPISFPFLLDEDRNVTKQYGVYQRVGLDGINLAHPSTFVVDASGYIRFLHIGTTQFDRAPVEEVVAALENAK
ncbi:MAG: redoxin family protein [Acidobacteriota bacterium]|nr:redoxin family protein [Acidobacteriota bacterium]